MGCEGHTYIDDVDHTYRNVTSANTLPGFGGDWLILRVSKKMILLAFHGGLIDTWIGNAGKRGSI